MKKFLIFAIIFNTMLFATSKKEIEIQKLKRLEKQIQKEMEKEKRYHKEQTFYQGKNYDLKSAEVNLDSLASLPDIEEDDTDTDMLEMD